MGENRLAGSRYLWLIGQERLDEKQRERFEKIYRNHLATEKKSTFKEILRDQ
jgi:hypothetical protein